MPVGSKVGPQIGYPNRDFSYFLLITSGKWQGWYLILGHNCSCYILPNALIINHSKTNFLNPTGYVMHQQVNPFNAGIKFLRATLHVQIFIGNFNF
jgi:hypothetical protein